MQFPVSKSNKWFEDYCRLGLDALQSDICLPTFRMSVLPLSSGLKYLGLFNTEYGNMRVQGLPKCR
jgi:hypothetical protein